VDAGYLKLDAEGPIIMIKERSSFTIGEEATLTKLVSDDDIKAFAQISGDDNPVHMNDEYAKGTLFGGRIAHGILVAGLISAVLGTMLPGPGAIYLSQQLRFLAPVRPGDEVTARAKVTGWDPKKGRVTLFTEVANKKGIAVIAGEAHLVMSSYLKR
jgi:3-hydroxybutyryl-CoA dehydratase